MGDMNNSLAQRLNHYVELGDADTASLRAASNLHPKRIAPRTDILQEGRPCGGLHVVVSGWACQYKLLRDGRRQIIAFLLPGDVFGADAHLLPALDHSVGAITVVQVAEIDPDALDAIVSASPAIRRALRIGALVDAAAQRAHMVNLGQRSALERVGHMLCALFRRSRAIGLADGNQCDFPITQTDLADATGLTPVHVNRTLKEFRLRGMIVVRERRLTVSSFETLCQAVDFDPGYLQLGDIASATTSPVLSVAA